MPVWVQTQLDPNSAPSGTSTLTTANVSLQNTFTSGNGLAGMVLVFPGTNGPTAISSITDNAGNNYTVIQSISTSTAFGSTVGFNVLFGAASVIGSPTTLTINFSGATGSSSWVFTPLADELSGLSSINQHAEVAITAATTSFSSGTATVPAGDMCWGGCFLSIGTATVTSSGNWTSRTSNTVSAAYTQSQLAASTGALASTFSLTTADKGMNGLITFRPFVSWGWGDQGRDFVFQPAPKALGGSPT